MENPRDTSEQQQCKQMVITVFIALSAFVKDIQFQFPLNSVAIEVREVEKRRKERNKETNKQEENKKKAKQGVCVAISK